jgi:hypothetical protein
LTSAAGGSRAAGEESSPTGGKRAVLTFRRLAAPAPARGVGFVVATAALYGAGPAAGVYMNGEAGRILIRAGATAAAGLTPFAI